jgi:hypothetical protein
MNGFEIHLQSHSGRKCYIFVKTKGSLMELSSDTLLIIHI